MGALSVLLITLSSIAVSFAAPASSEAKQVDVDLAARGPHDFILGADNALSRRAAIDYDQDYTTDSTVSYSPTSTGFSVDWSNSQDFVVGVGWQTGTTRYILPSP